MKKALASILVFIALTNIVGFMPLYFSALQEIKSEVNLKLASGTDLQQLQITNAEYNNPALFNTSEEKEFRFRGQMYDYTTMQKTGSGYVFYVVPDNKESNLIEFLKSVYGQSNANGKGSKAPLSNLFKNFSKDFVGSFSKLIQFPLSRATGFVVLLANATSSGYFSSIQNPPDFRA